MTEQERESWEWWDAMSWRAGNATWAGALAGVAAAMVTGSGVFTLAVMAVAFYLVWRVV